MRGQLHSLQSRASERNAVCVRVLRLALGRGGARFVRADDVCPLRVCSRDGGAE